MAFTGTRTLTDRSILNSLLYKLDAGLGAAWYGGITRRVVSDQPNGETHGWLGGVPGMTERKGDPKFDKLQGNTFFIRNVPFHTGLLIPREDWLFQRFGQIDQRINDLVVPALNHPGELILSAIAAGESTNCYDGQYFFDTDHLEGASGTQSNDLTYAKAGTNPTAAEVKAAILAAIAAMWAFKDDKGQYCNLGATRFMVGAPAALMPTVLEVLGVTTQVGGNTAILNANNAAFQLTPQILPSITGNKLYVFRQHEANMGSAFIHQVLIPSEPVALGIDSEHCKLTGNLLYKIEGTYNVGFGRWQDASLTTFTGP